MPLMKIKKTSKFKCSFEMWMMHVYEASFIRWFFPLRRSKIMKPKKSHLFRALEVLSEMIKIICDLGRILSWYLEVMLWSSVYLQHCFTWNVQEVTIWKCQPAAGVQNQNHGTSGESITGSLSLLKLFLQQRCYTACCIRHLQVRRPYLDSETSYSDHRYSVKFPILALFVKLIPLWRRPPGHWK